MLHSSPQTRRCFGPDLLRDQPVDFVQVQVVEATKEGSALMIRTASGTNRKQSARDRGERGEPLVTRGQGLERVSVRARPTSRTPGLPTRRGPLVAQVAYRVTKIGRGRRDRSTV